MSGSAGKASGDNGSYGDGDYASGEGTTTGAATGSTGSGAIVPGVPGEEPIEPEVEDVPEFELPHAGQRYVYAVNPERDTVAVIDATTLGIHTVDAGDEPRFLQTLGGKDQAIVLNVKSEDAMVIRTAEGASSTSFVDVAPGSNAIAVSPFGSHAVVYLNSEYAASGLLLESQSVSVLTLGEGEDRATDMSVGYRPSAVYFSEDGQRAFVVTEDGLSVLDFAAIDEEGPSVAPTISVGEDVDSKARDVSVTQNGAYALARQEGGSTLRLVDLDTGEAEQIDVALLIDREPTPSEGAGGAGGSSGEGDSATGGSTTGTPSLLQAPQVTDVDLSPNNDFAIAVVRPDNVVLTIPIPDGFSDPENIRVIEVEQSIIGSATLSPDGEFAVLYVTAVASEEKVTLLELETGELQTVDLRKAVRSVAIDTESQTALVVHKKLEGEALPTDDPDTKTDLSYGYSMVELGSGFSRLQLTPSDVKAFTLLPQARALFVLFQETWQVERMDLDSFVPEHVTLASRPVAMGAVPESEKLFVGQEHPDGRITFIDYETLETTSVTGFELNSQIQER